MRYVVMLIGTALVVAGIWALNVHPSFHGNETLAHIGSLTLTQPKDQPIPRWIDVSAIVVGGIIVLAGLSARRRR